MAESNYDGTKEISKRQADHCAKCGSKLGTNYVTGNKLEKYKDQDGKRKTRRAQIKTIYCNEDCCEADNAELSDKFSF